MITRKVDLYFFSGTGNTWRIAGEVQRILSEQGHQVNLYRMEEYQPVLLDGDTTVGLIFPVSTQSVAPFIWKFMKTLPKAAGTAIFMVATLNESSGIVAPLYHLVKKKGYQPVGAREISMPNNLVLDAEDEQAVEEKTEKALHTVRDFCDELTIGKSRWLPKNSGSSFISFLGRQTILPWFFMRLLFRLEVDVGHCSHCGTCIRLCPVHNIAVDSLKHRGKCEFCLRCAAFCPEQAVKFRGRSGVKVRKTMDQLF